MVQTISPPLKYKFRNLKLLIARISFVYYKRTQKNKQKNIVLIIPPDTGNVGGSLGDIAMLSGLISELSARHRSTEFIIIGNTWDSVEIPFHGRIKVIPAWLGIKGMLTFLKTLPKSKALFGIGADVLDGKYNESHVIQFVGYCNFAAQHGIKTIITGFSLNRNPTTNSITALKEITTSITVNIRDEYSKDVFSKYSNKKSQLCADLAFLMPKDDSTKTTIDCWIKKQKSQKKRLIGINLNFHALGEVIDQLGIEAFIRRASEKIIDLSTLTQAAIVLIPHDIKSSSGDIFLLNLLHKELLNSDFHDVVVFESNNPSIIKSITGNLDLVITARMHLAIASLGSGTPILAIEYQDKFRGLLKHFDFDDYYIVRAHEYLDDSTHTKALNIINNDIAFRKKINGHLRNVTTLAKNNFQRIN